MQKMGATAIWNCIGGIKEQTSKTPVGLQKDDEHCKMIQNADLCAQKHTPSQLIIFFESNQKESKSPFYGMMV